MSQVGKVVYSGRKGGRMGLKPMMVAMDGEFDFHDEEIMK